MLHPFDDACRTEIATRVAAFRRQPAAGDEAGLKRAAVALVVTDTADGSGEAAFLLTRRASGLRAHANQWALPGGRCDAGEGPVDAALRELDEELGLRIGAGDVFGLLDDYPTRSGYLVTPVVAWAGSAPVLRPNPAEVASVHRIPLAEIMREAAIDFTSIPESRRRVVRLSLSGDVIHAPTAALIYQFREVLAGRPTRVADLEQPLFAWR